MQPNLLESQNCLVLQYQRNRKQQFKLLIQSSQQELAGSASGGSLAAKTDKL